MASAREGCLFQASLVEVLERVGNLSLRFVTDTLYVYEMTGVPFINGRDTIGVPFLY